MQKQTVLRCARASLGLTLAAGTAHAQIVQWSKSSGGNGHCYQVVYESQGVTWDAASLNAINRGGHLVSIANGSENAFVYRLVAGDSRFWTSERVASTGATYYHGPWLGASQPVECTPVDPSCGWVWASGEPWSYTNWYPGEPNDLTYAGGLIENRLQFFGATGPNAGWNDRPNNRSAIPIRAYIVEYDGSNTPPQAVYNVGYADTCLLSLPSAMSWFNGWPWKGLRYPGENYTSNGSVHNGLLDVAVLGSGEPAANAQGIVAPRALYFGDFCVAQGGTCISPAFHPAATVSIGSLQVQDLDWTFDFGPGSSNGGWACGGQPGSTPGGLKVLGTDSECGTPLIIGMETSVSKIPGHASLTLRGPGTLEAVGTVIGDSSGSTGELTLAAFAPPQTTAATYKTGALWIGHRGAGNLFAYSKSSISTAGASVAIDAPANVVLTGATWTDSKSAAGGTIFGVSNAANVSLTGTTMTLDAANPLVLGQGSGSSCTLLLDSSSVLANAGGSTIIGDGGSAQVTLRGGSSASLGSLTMSRLIGSTSTMTVQGSTTALTTGALTIGGLGSATLNLSSAGNTNLNGNAFVGQNSTGVVNLSASRINCGPLTLGRYSDSLGTGSGTIDLSNSARIAASGTIIVGNGGLGQLNVASASSVTGTDLLIAVAPTSISGIFADAAALTFTGTTVIGGSSNVIGGTGTIGLDGSARFTTKNLNVWPSGSVTINGGASGQGGGVNVGVSTTITPKTMVVEAGSTLNLGGTLNGNLRIAGGAASPGYITPGTGTVNGALTLTSTAVFDIDVGTVGSAVVADSLAVNGTVTLAGRLVVLVDPATKLAGRFVKTVISGSSRSGTFSATTLPPRWRVNYGTAPDLVVLSYCAADFNTDGFLSFEDFDDFITSLESGNAAADFNGDGFLTFEDFDAFIVAFESGC